MKTSEKNAYSSYSFMKFLDFQWILTVLWIISIYNNNQYHQINNFMNIDTLTS